VEATRKELQLLQNGLLPSVVAYAGISLTLHKDKLLEFIGYPKKGKLRKLLKFIRK